MTEPAEQPDLSWRRRETVAVIVLGVLAGAALGVRAAGRAPWPGCSGQQQRARSAEAVEFINPNTASVGSLIRLHKIGPARAQAIVAYRCRPGAEPFRRLEDLKRVRGIGEGVIRDVRRDEAYLRFGEAPTSR